jgi:hypothetical protein
MHNELRLYFVDVLVAVEWVSIPARKFMSTNGKLTPRKSEPGAIVPLTNDHTWLDIIIRLGKDIDQIPILWIL